MIEKPLEDEQRFLDLDEGEESPYLRRQRRVEVRRSGSRKLLRRVGQGAVVAAALAVAGLAVYGVVGFLLHDERFLLRDERVEVQGTRYVTRAQVLERFAGDIGRSVFAVRLERRRQMLEQLAWVKNAQVARLWPNRIRVVIRERTPVAFLRTSAGLALVDRAGVVLDRPAQATFSFPVVTGIPENDSAEERGRRMALFTALVEELDRGGAAYSADISEVDLSDPEDARLLVADSEGRGAVLVHMGNQNFLERYKTYLAHIQEWRQSFPKLGSVDLRYERQVVVNPETR